MISRSSSRKGILHSVLQRVQFAMAVLPPTHEERLAALSLNDDGRSVTSVSEELCAVTIDRNRILEGVGGDEALVDAMLALFVSQVSSSRSGLWAAADAADWPLLERRAHVLKSDCALCCCDEARDLAAALEVAAKAGDAPECARLLPNVLSACERAAAAAAATGTSAAEWKSRSAPTPQQP